MCIIIVEKDRYGCFGQAISILFLSALTKTRGSTIEVVYFFFCHSTNHLLLSPAPAMRVSDEHLSSFFLCHSQYI